MNILRNYEFLSRSLWCFFFWNIFNSYSKEVRFRTAFFSIFAAITYPLKIWWEKILQFIFIYVGNFLKLVINLNTTSEKLGVYEKKIRIHFFPDQNLSVEEECHMVPPLYN